jgi:hypothetical protein
VAVSAKGWIVINLELKPLDLSGVADRMLVRIVQAITTSGRWNKTGHLLQSLDVQTDAASAAVTVAGDRLERPELQQMFFDEITPHDVDHEARKAIGEAIRDALVIGRVK